MDWLDTLYEDIAEPYITKKYGLDETSDKSSKENEANVKAYQDLQQDKAISPLKAPFGLSNNQMLFIAGGIVLGAILLLRGK